MRFRHRLLLLLLLPLLAAVAITGLLTYRAFDQLHVGLVQSRLGFILANLRTTAEANLSLGLRIDQLTVMQDLIERERAGNPTIRAIELFDRTGLSLFSTDRGAIGEPVADSWLRALSGLHPDGTWRLAERGDLLLGLVVENDLGEVAGSLVITVAAAEPVRRSREIAGFVTLLGLITAVITGLLTLVAARYLGRLATRPFDAATQLLAGQDSAVWNHSDELPHRVPAVQAALTTARHALDSAEQELAAIDAAG